MWDCKSKFDLILSILKSSCFMINFKDLKVHHNHQTNPASIVYFSSLGNTATLIQI